MNFRKHLLLACLAAPLAIAGASLAQPAGGAPAHDMAMTRPDPAAMADKHAQHLRDALQLRPDQEGALRALIEATKPNEQMMEHMRRSEAEEASLTTPQKLDRMLAHMDEHRAMMVRHIEAVKRFWAQLSPGQQKAFDAMHEGHGHGMGGMDGPHELMMRRMGHPPMEPGMDGPGHDAPTGPPPG